MIAVAVAVEGVVETVGDAVVDTAVEAVTGAQGLCSRSWVMTAADAEPEEENGTGGASGVRR